jgi:hypothetical protein
MTFLAEEQEIVGGELMNLGISGMVFPDLLAMVLVSDGDQFFSTAFPSIPEF